MVPESRALAMVHVSVMGPYAWPPAATVRLTVSWSAEPPALLVAMSHTSWGMGWRTNLPFVCWRMAGRAKVPVHENEPLVVVSAIWMASASPVAHVHMRSGASMPLGHTVLSYG